MMQKEEAKEYIVNNGVIAVLRKIPSAYLLKLSETLVNSGVKCLEVTMDTMEASSAIEMLNKHFNGEALIGAGTVRTAEMAVEAKRAGASFLFSPFLSSEVLEAGRSLGIITAPGAMTPTEIHEASVLGADLVKVFPAEVLGSGFIKGVGAVLGNQLLIPTGGITEKNARDYIRAGAAAVGVGGSLMNVERMESGQYHLISNIAKQIAEQVQEAKST
ncbi:MULTISPECIES: bifunctional 4-hydroxy-2-oxoglutarate aldolase/2-dehydro-3-deoxy-phosphogluconate aldolase [unclassified Sutcliffiella]|jgi:2-dehydro-3-deoxyphosphogluconate aldolase/(4S)-4-hydroxy-2-oxoglutarate aldolase|uniref:bifunctional 4-hydroxy-2-oxoglutarate aldolase/2-dehydro-3-deoxy-phosphogluconate aldolase n=1 Tax=unclassified Sutcliffiella TaxID=2837532 RepID=UPI0030CDB851